MKAPAQEVKLNKEVTKTLAQPNREYKDTLFRMIFNDREQLLNLYNAVNGTSYDDLTEVEIVTLENAIYMNVKNDVAFLMDFCLNLYEHQSTYNPNIPLRNLFYVAKEYQKLVEQKSLYTSVPIKIPTPKFVVFYNGIMEQEEKKELRLSDLFAKQEAEPELELKVLMLNINYGHNKELMEQCRLLKEYSMYVARVRTYAGKMDIKEAVERAVNECIKEGILEKFLRKCRAEAIEVSIFEYDEEWEMKKLRQAEYDAGVMDGREKGKSEGKSEGKYKNLLELICKKLAKNKSLSQIAEELEEDEDTIRPLYEAAKAAAPEYDIDKIYDSLFSLKK